MVNRSRIAPLVGASLLVGVFSWAQPAAAAGLHHHVAVVGGMIQTESHGETHRDKVVGGEYELQLSLPVVGELIGVTAFGERVLDAKGWIAGGGVVVRPLLGIKLLAAVGSEWSHGHRANLTRVGVGYDIGVLMLSVTPMLALDRVAGRNVL